MYYSVDGGMSEWTAWSDCHSQCGVQYRTRQCDNPTPQNGGKECFGPTYETKRCGDDQTCQGCSKFNIHTLFPFSDYIIYLVLCSFSHTVEPAI